MVEVDPFAPDSVPVKRTAFGRYCRECSVLSLGEDGRMAFYSGDDTKGEYVYKFVPSGRFVAGADADNRRLLDEGTLYVARFDADGSGEWLALVHGEHGLTAENGFPGQAEVLLNARAAADRAGATPMDRPEWVAVQPHSREVYVTLTNNDGRGAKQPLDRANPAPTTCTGKSCAGRKRAVIRPPRALSGRSFCSPASAAGAGRPGQPGGGQSGRYHRRRLSSPDGLAFDAAGRLWIETDFDDDQPAMQAMGTNQLLCADPVTREVRRFLVGPRGCEITGITWSPDYRAMGERAAPGAELSGQRRPITSALVHRADHQDDGGVIGS